MGMARMTAAGVGATDAFLARSLAGPAPWPGDASGGEVVSRALFHGIAGCLAGRPTAHWPPRAAEPIRRAATAQAMWEVRHRLLLSRALEALEAAGVRCLLLKGTALAYDLYESPSARSRGDSDLLVAPADLDRARAALAACGFAHFLDDPAAMEAVRLQECWRQRSADGLVHDIDLHWQAVNAVVLADVMPFDRLWERARPLPRLSPRARGLPHDLALLLACVHRMQHVLNPYFVDGAAHYGGNRLIWLRDIDLLARALDPGGWAAFEAATIEGGLSAVALDGLRAAAGRLGTPLPPGATARLAAAPQDSPAARYLLAGHRAERAWRDLRAVPGLGPKAAYLWGRLLPPPAFMRAKYPGLAGRPLPLLHLRRLRDFLAPDRERGRR